MTARAAPPLRLYDARAGKARIFEPADPGRVTMYVCGPTVYADIHIGNARPLVVFDLLYRLLRRGYGQVDYVRNITDIDDKIIAAAAAADEEPAAFAARYADAFAGAAAALGCLEPARQPRATEHIADMIALAARLLERGHAYEAEGHVLFAVDSWPAYGSLARRSTEEMIAGARVEVAAYKRAPGDFVLWKPAPEPQPGWDSPWGRGRPGWHLECSAMIQACLGENLDIHGGGIDLLFPHHENENAQSCCAFGGDSLARFWVHNGHLTVAGDKMAKSAGNVDRVKDLLAAQPGEAVRYALLAAHYRSPLDWSPAFLAAARQALDRLYRSMEGEVDEDSEAEPPAAFLEALADDLNTPVAFAALHALAKRINQSAGTEAAGLRAQLRAAGDCMGLLGHDPAAWFQDSAAGLEPAAIEARLAERTAARERGDYAAADAIREQLAADGVLIEDTDAGPVWRRAEQ